MVKPKNMDNNDENAEYVKQLENDLLKLKIENAYLKELRRLRLEQEALIKGYSRSVKLSKVDIYVLAKTI